MKVIENASFATVDVLADGMGLSSRAGSALLALTAQRLGLTDGLSGALAGTRQRRSAHEGVPRQRLPSFIARADEVGAQRQGLGATRQAQADTRDLQGVRMASGT